MRAAVAGMVAPTQRGTAYGIFNAAYGFSWFFGTALMGVLYEVSLGYLVAFSVGLELLSVGLELLSVPVLLVFGSHIARTSSR